MGSVNTSDYTIILCIIIHKSTINKLVFKQFMWIVDIKHNPLNLYKLPLTIKKIQEIYYYYPHLKICLAIDLFQNNAKM